MHFNRHGTFQNAEVLYNDGQRYVYKCLKPDSRNRIIYIIDTNGRPQGIIPFENVKRIIML